MEHLKVMKFKSLLIGWRTNHRHLRKGSAKWIWETTQNTVGIKNNVRAVRRQQTRWGSPNLPSQTFRKTQEKAISRELKLSISQHWRDLSIQDEGVLQVNPIRINKTFAEFFYLIRRKSFLQWNELNTEAKSRFYGSGRLQNS